MGLDHSLPFSLPPPFAAVVAPLGNLIYRVLHVDGLCKRKGDSGLAFFSLPFSP